MEKKFIFAKIFKVFPRGGALARFGKAVVFLSWFNGGEEELGKVVYFYPEDLQKGPKGLYVENYLKEKPAVTRKELLQDVEECQKNIYYFFEVGEEESLLQKNIKIYLKTKKDPQAYKKVPFKKVWNKVSWGSYEIYLKKALSFKINGKAQEKIKKMLKKVEGYKEKGAVDYINSYVSESLKSLPLEKALERANLLLDEKIKEWEQDIQEEKERERRRQQMVEDFCKAAEEVSSIDDVVFF